MYSLLLPAARVGDMGGLLRCRRHFSAISSIFADLMPYLACWRAAKLLHAGLLENVLRTPLQFFEVTPIGRILSRFSKDVDVLDTSLPSQLTDVTYCAFEVGDTHIFWRSYSYIFVVFIEIFVCLLFDWSIRYKGYRTSNGLYVKSLFFCVIQNGVV